MRNAGPALVLLAVAVLASFVVVVIVSLAQLSALLPQYADRADELLASLAGSLSGFDVAPGQLEEAVSAISPLKVVTLIGTMLAGLAATLSSRSAMRSEDIRRVHLC